MLHIGGAFCRQEAIEGAPVRRLGLQPGRPAEPQPGRYQIVKGWLDASGKLHEKVYDVAWSGERKPDASGKLPPVGSTVDIANATWSNSIGASELVAVWQDPEFDPAQSAFYYGRVLEIPTPRWTAYDVKRLGAEALKGTTMVLQERAYTSPVWYKPAG